MSGIVDTPENRASWWKARDKQGVSLGELLRKKIGERIEGFKDEVGKGSEKRDRK